MKKILSTTLCALMILSSVSMDAEAKRLGGGSKSVGMQRESVMQRQATPSAPASQPAARPQQMQQQPAQPMSQPQPMAQKRSWLGPLAGLAAGIGLAALASHFGFGEELASMMMMALLAMLAVVAFKWLFRRKDTQPRTTFQSSQFEPQYAGAGQVNQAEPTEHAYQASQPVAGSTSQPSAHIPADFDAEGFVRQAKLNFIRLQAANDAGNLEDLREFTTPEMFAELRMQILERGTAPQQTDVLKLEAEVVDVTTEAARYIVSVRFWGDIREEQAGPVCEFAEVWHLTKPTSGNHGWVIAGIEQIG